MQKIDDINERGEEQESYQHAENALADRSVMDTSMRASEVLCVADYTQICSKS